MITINLMEFCYASFYRDPVTYVFTKCSPAVNGRAVMDIFIKRQRIGYYGVKK